MKFNTKAVHEGVRKDESYNSVITPIYPSSTFRFDRIGENRGYDYTRSGNPTRKALEENIAALEEGVAASCTSTGMSASTAVLHLLKTGDHVITGNDIYGGTYRLMTSLFSDMGIKFDFIDMASVSNIKQYITSTTKMIWIETPSNPLLRIVDIRAICRIAQEQSLIVVVDNTFMTPYFQKPLLLGADISLHSTTKYINGHSDVVGGAIVSKTLDLAQKIYFNVNALGVSEAPFDSWLVLRGVKTLPLRMEKHQQNALKIAEFLNHHPKVIHTYYPGLKTHPNYELCQSQSSGFGAMLSFDLDESQLTLDDFFAKLKYYSLAESLGGVESLIEAPWYMSHASMSEEARNLAGIKKCNVRVSVGIEDSEDLIEDLSQALD
ncbi:MAG: PLP-dependent transferase [Spirochaetales bacterium]|nr:PLP-dependent transferase [Spirochaetales bacterium]